MSVFAANKPFLTAAALAVLTFASLGSDATAQNAPPNFMGGAAWLGGGFSHYLVELGGWPGWHISGDWPPEMEIPLYAFHGVKT